MLLFKIKKALTVILNQLQQTLKPALKYQIAGNVNTSTPASKTKVGSSYFDTLSSILSEFKRHHPLSRGQIWLRNKYRQRPSQHYLHWLQQRCPF